METFYIFIHGVGFTYLFMLGVYMFFSSKRRFPVTCPNPFLRRITGVNLIAWSLSYILGLMDYFLYVQSAYDINVFTLQIEFFLIPLAMLMLVGLVQYQEMRWKRFVRDIVIPVILFVCFCVTRNDMFFVASAVYWMIYVILFVGYFSRKARNYTKLLKENFSDLENRELQWVGIFTTIIVSYLIVHFIALLINNSIYLCVSYAIGMFAWSYVTWHIEHQEPLFVFQQTKNDDTDKRPVVEEIIQDTTEEVLKQIEVDDEKRKMLEKLAWIGDSLHQKCVEEQMYLQPDLNLATLSQQIGTNRTYLSQYLKLQDTNFYTYINTLRIEYAKKLMESGGKITQSDIARQSGFNSLNSFRRVYFSITGKDTL